jgi:hypothetical protein
VGRLARRALVRLVTLSAIALAATAAADERATAVRGACYCRSGGHVECVANVTRTDCERNCKLALHDDWFWLERRPCWNWGYGG